MAAFPPDPLSGHALQIRRWGKQHGEIVFSKKEEG